MTPALQNILTKRGLALLRLTEEDWEALEGSRQRGTRFSLVFPHDAAHSGKPQCLVLIATAGEFEMLRIGIVRSIQATATFDSRVVFDLVQPITPSSLDELLEMAMEPRLRQSIAKLDADKFQPISPKLGEQLLRLIVAFPENAPALQRITAELHRPSRFTNARALQQDAVNLALKAFGVTTEAAEIDLPGGDTSLATVRLTEDAVIEHDARWPPGLSLTDSELTGRAVFKNREEQMEVFTANKRPLEELFGVDLIYYNRTRGALVMVQYKMMEPQERKRKEVPGVYGGVRYEGEDQEWEVAIDKQFKSELRRMETFDRDLDPEGHYRLNGSPFFFKLMKRNATTKASGIMLSLGHLKQMIAEGLVTGPRGGLRINYRSLDGHYLRSDPFVELIRSGYIGSRGATTAHLEALSVHPETA